MILTRSEILKTGFLISWPSDKFEILLILIQHNFQHMEFIFNSFLASGNFCLLLTTFANSFDPEHAEQNFRPDLDPNYLTL